MAEVVDRLNAALEGHYRIESQLGEGGMATVYLADDLRHERKVALKVLKPELAAVVGADRFLAEIKTTASLQHPHILPLHDSGDADGFLYYVMPYVQQESLRQRLDREHQLPVDEAVGIASKVAAALDYAHRQGVIHRDIKPANVLLEEGEPVIGDFGIALAVTAAGGNRLTETGLSLGTPHYMSPEQATGDQTVGPATDIWALGCVLYEMLVGEPPYTGSTPQAILGKIITGKPDSVTLQRNAVPTNVDAVIAKALEKVPADRFGTAQDLVNALGDPAFRHGQAAVLGAGVAPERWRAFALTSAAAAFLLAASQVWSLTRPDPSRQVARLMLTGLAENHQPLGDFVLGPQNSGFVYQGSDGQFWYKRWDELTPRPIGPFNLNNWLSPDGRTLSLLAGGQIQLLPLDGGPVRHLADSVGFNPNWGGDGYLYFAGTDGTIHRQSVDGGPVERLDIELSEGEFRHHRFQPLPGGEKAVFAAFGKDGGCRIWGIDLVTRERRLLAEGIDPRVTPTGHLVFGDLGGRLMAARIDPDALELGPFAALGPTLRRINACALFYWFASDGTLGYWEADSESGTHEMVWVSRAGAVTLVDPSWLFNPGVGIRGWALSPDNSKIAVRASMGGAGSAGVEMDIWINDLVGGTVRKLTSWQGEDRAPAWLSDSTIVYVSTMGGATGRDVFTMRVDGTGEPELLYDHRINIIRAEPSLRGDWLVLQAGTGPTDADILTLRLGADEGATPLLARPEVEEVQPALSPDGRWLAYTSDETDRYEVNVRPFPNVEATQVAISRAGGSSPFWPPDGKELFYVTPDRILMAAQVAAEPSFRVISQQALFPIGPEYVGGANEPFARVADDGRFLMMRSATERRPQFVLVFNWFEELNRLVPN